MGRLRFTILGCGSSGGVPRLGGIWGACDPADPRNRRRRCSLLIERFAEDAPADGATPTRVLIDTSPDLREQLLGADVGALDAVAYTHSHADHMHGIDDLRMIVFNRAMALADAAGTRIQDMPRDQAAKIWQASRVPVWADDATSEVLLSRFGYAFVQPEGSPYPPILDLHGISGDLRIEGAGGPITLRPFEVRHGSMDALGFRIGDLAYLPDVSEIPDAALPLLEGLDIWILDALRPGPHPTHFHLERALQWIERMNPQRAVLTNLHIDMDFSSLDAQTPAHVSPAHDGLVIEMPG